MLQKIPNQLMMGFFFPTGCSDGMFLFSLKEPVHRNHSSLNRKNTVHIHKHRNVVAHWNCTSLLLLSFKFRQISLFFPGRRSAKCLTSHYENEMCVGFDICLRITFINFLCCVTVEQYEVEASLKALL